jgi:hypothetical protein
VVQTATVTPPPDARALARKDPSVRMRDYVEALEHYLHAPGVDRVIFIENSGSDLAPLRDASTRLGQDARLQLIALDTNDYPSAWGKGYGEFQMLDQGLAAALRERPIAEGDVLWKVTGRLRVTNLAELHASMPASAAVYCDLRQVAGLSADLLPGNRWMDLRVFACTQGGYDRYLRNQYESLRIRYEGDIARRGPEHILFERLYEALRTGEDHRIAPRFLVQPRVVGVQGYSNRAYHSGPYKAKEDLRALARKISPWLWI